MELRNYTNIPEQGTKVFGGSGKYSNISNTYNGNLLYGLDPNTSLPVNPDDLTNVNVSKSVNAIEIDWNGYNTGTKVINNTVDFLDWIEEETEKVKPSFSQEADHYQPSAYNGEIIKDNIPISVDGKSTNISVDQYGHFLIDGLPREFGYLYIGDGECTNDSDHLIHNHINRNNFKQLADVYYYPAYIKKTAIEYTVDPNNEYGYDGDNDVSTVYIVIKEGFKWYGEYPKDLEKSDFKIYIGNWEYTGELKKFDTYQGYNFFKLLNGVEDGKNIRLELQTDAPLR